MSQRTGISCSKTGKYPLTAAPAVSGLIETVGSGPIGDFELFDHFVGAAEQGWRYTGSRPVELGWSLNRQVCWIGSAQDSVDVLGRLPAAAKIACRYDVVVASGVTI